MSFVLFSFVAVRTGIAARRQGRRQERPEREGLGQEEDGASKAELPRKLPPAQGPRAGEFQTASMADRRGPGPRRHLQLSRQGSSPLTNLATHFRPCQVCRLPSDSPKYSPPPPPSTVGLCLSNNRFHLIRSNSRRGFKEELSFSFDNIGHVFTGFC